MNHKSLIGLGVVVLAGVVLFLFFIPSAERNKQSQTIEVSDGIETSTAMPASQPLEINHNPEKEIQEEIDLLIAQRNYTSALQRVDELLSSVADPHIVERLNLYKGNLLFASGDLQQAYDVYRQLLLNGKRDDIRDWTTVKLYVVADKLGTADEVIGEFLNIYEQQPHNPRLGYILADLYAYNGKPDKESEIRNVLLTDEPGNLDNGMKLMAAYGKMKNPSAAAEVSGRMAEADPKNEAAHLFRQATLLLQANDNEKASSVCDAVLSSKIANAQVLLRCGYLYEQLGNYDQAIAAFAKASEIATEQYREERCVAESLRLKQREEALSSDEVRILEDLAQGAQAQAVRALAKDILGTNK